MGWWRQAWSDKGLFQKHRVLRSGQPSQLATADRTQKDEGLETNGKGVLLQERTR